MLEYLKEQLERVNYWLAFAETKNAALIAFNVAVLAAMGKMVEVNIWISACSYVLILIATFICLVSFISILSGQPKKNEKTEKQDVSKNNLVFYEKIANLDADTYIDELKNKYHLHIVQWEEKECEDFAKEIIINSQIAVRKYKLFNYAVKIDLICIILFVLAIILA